MRCNQPGRVASRINLPDCSDPWVPPVGRLNNTIHVVARTVDGFYRPDNLMGAPLKLQGLGEDVP